MPLDTEQRFEELKDRTAVTAAEVDELFEALDTVTPEEILGEWKGGIFATGHHGSEGLEHIAWYGKTFNSRLDAKPLICHDEDGNLYSNDVMMGGEATLWEIRFRGRVSTSMVYNGAPVVDHFRKVDADTLVGVMDGAESVFDAGQHFYFFLERP